jgi:hypothetical protein
VGVPRWRIGADVDAAAAFRITLPRAVRIIAFYRIASHRIASHFAQPFSISL